MTDTPSRIKFTKAIVTLLHIQRIQIRFILIRDLVTEGTISVFTH